MKTTIREQELLHCALSEKRTQLMGYMRNLHLNADDSGNLNEMDKESYRELDKDLDAVEHLMAVLVFGGAE